MRKETNKFLFRITVCALSVLATTSCSKDDFFRIDDTPCVDLQTKYAIAGSDIYIDYQIACFAFADELSKIDSTKRSRVLILNNDTVYENVYVISFSKVCELHDSLLNVYPVLKDADEVDLIQILNIALNNNSTLRDLVPKSVVNSNCRTKSYNGSSYALQWLEGSSFRNYSGTLWNGKGLAEQNSQGTWVWTFEAIPCSSIGDAMELACIWSINHGEVEVGGWGWTDGSGMMTYCHQATASQSPVLHAAGTPRPELDFHVHPSGNLIPSDSDLIAWSKSPDLFHLIINYAHEMVIW